MSRVVVTGASGFIGRHLVPALAARGDEVVCLVRRSLAQADPVREADPTGPRGGRVREIVTDLLDPVSYAPELRGCDHVVHLAGLLESRRAEEFHRVNVEATRCLIAACLEAEAPRGRFVLMSSVAAMGPAASGRLRESDPCRPRSEYGRSKCEAELVALAAAGALRLLILRPAFVYGPGDRRALAVLPALLPGRPAGLAEALVATFSLCHVRDVVGAILRALDGRVEPGEVLLVSHAEVLTWTRLRAVVAEVLAEIAPELAAIPPALTAASQDPDVAPAARFARAAPSPFAVDWACDTARASRLLGFTAGVPLAEGVRETLRWYRDRGLLDPLVAGAALRAKEAS